MRRLAASVLLLALALIVFRGPTQSGAVAPAQVSPTVANYLPAVRRPLEPTNTPTATVEPTATPTERPGLPKFQNPGFEQGHTGWTEIPGNAIITQFAPVTAHAGTWLAQLGGESDSRDELQQSLKLPAAPVYLRYERQIDIDSGDLDINEFIIWVNGVPLRNDTLLFLDTGSKWEVDSLDLSTYAGQVVTLRFSVYMDNLCYVYLDDIALSSHP